MPYLGNFRWKFKTNIAIFEISTAEFVKITFLNKTVNFGIGLSFTEGPGSLFS